MLSLCAYVCAPFDARNEANMKKLFSLYFYRLRCHNAIVEFSEAVSIRPVSKPFTKSLEKIRLVRVHSLRLTMYII